jgi:hypothetical protein
MTLMATALCADRAVVSSAAVVPVPATQSQTLVGRLSAGLRRAVPGVRLYQVRCDNQRALASPAKPVYQPSFIPPLLSPFSFRLPPPLAA